MIYATRSYIENLVNGLSEKTGIKFIEGRVFGVDIVNKTFTYDSHILQKASIDEVKGIILHEVGHLNYTTIHKPTAVQKKYPQVQSLYNACEDVRIEQKMITKYGSFAANPISYARWYAVYENHRHMDKLLELSPYMQFMLYLYSYFLIRDENNLIDREYINSYCVNMINRIPQDVSHSRVSINEIYSLKSKILACATTADVIKIVDTEIVPEIEDLLKQEKSAAEQMHGMVADLQKMVKSLIKTSADLLDAIGTGEGDNIPKMTKLPEDEELKKIYGISIYNLTSRMKAILQEKTTIKYAGSYKRGRLISKNIYKVLTSERRLYSKRTHPDTPFYEVTFVLDESGSMSSSKSSSGSDSWGDAYTAAFIIDQACRNLKFKINYIGFGTNVYFYEKLPREMHSGGNNELKMIEAVKKTVSKTPENEHIVFILTDGECNEQPAPIIDRLERAGVRIFPIGIKVNEESFRQFYKTPMFIKTLDELVTVMISKMRDIIHR